MLKAKVSELENDAIKAEAERAADRAWERARRWQLYLSLFAALVAIVMGSLAIILK